MNRKGLMVNLQESAMFLAGISCKHIVFGLNVCCIPTIRKSIAFFKFFPFQFPLCPFKFTISILFCTCMEQIVSFFGGLEFVGYFFAYVAHFVLWRDVWIRTQRASKQARYQLSHPSPLLSHPSPFLATHFIV